MKSVLWRFVATAIVAIVSLPLAAPQSSAQDTLSVTLTENPFLCDAIVRPLGTVAGLIPGEAVEFSSPELNGVFSRRNADESGRVAMRWNCDAPQTWTVTVRGTTSGASATFVIAGETAPPPPDAPIGAAFDAKSAMTTAQMAIWKDFSPYNTAGVYIPVNSSWDNRADKVQTNLTPAWVSEVFADGWSLIPIYVGFQAPDRCATARYEGLSLDPATARAQGLAAAADAVQSVTRLGMPVGSPIYYDMEAYRSGCAEAVLSFLDAWTEGIHAEGFISGVYGSRSSTMFDLSRALGRAGFDAPDAVWVSTGNGRADAYGLEVPADDQWTNARMHQYRLNITRTYGGVTREVDENIVLAPLARAVAPSTAAPANPSGQIDDSDGDGIAEPSPDNCDNVANPDQADLDGDGDGDVCDTDIDGDGVVNPEDFAPNDPAAQIAPVATAEPTAVAQPSGADTDGDGFDEPAPDNCDNIANPDQADLDDDGDGDVCDTDIDGDGVPNEDDQEPRDPFIGAAPTPTPETDTTASEADTDGDGFDEPAPDNCDSIANPDQSDIDGDGDGDVCDTDIDGDGVPNEDDQEPRDPFIGAVPTPTPDADATATPVPPEPTPAAAESTPAPTPAEPTATVEPEVIVLPTPLPTAAAEPLPTVDAVSQQIAEPTVEPTADTPGPAPNDATELAAETVSITVQDESSVLPYAIAGLVVFSIFCVGMGVRSWRDRREIW